MAWPDTETAATETSWATLSDARQIARPP